MNKTKYFENLVII